MSIYDYLYRFWQESEHTPWSTTEAALYCLLLYEANRNYWKMPVCLHTSMIRFRLGTSKQNVLKAREGLQQRGYIRYKCGVSMESPAKYYLLAVPLTPPLTEALTPEMTDAVTGKLSPNMIKEEIHKDDDNCQPVQSATKKEEVLISLSELKGLLLADKNWREEVISILAKEGFAVNQKIIGDYLERFFSSLKSKSEESKTETDCRQYFINWTRKVIKNSKHYEQRSNDQRRGAEVTATSATDYDGAF